MEINKLKEILNKQIETASKENLYADLCYFKSSESRISLDKTNTEIDKGKDSGLKMRVWDNSKFIEFGQSSLEKENIQNNFKQLIEKAKHNNKKNTFKLSINKEEINKEFITQTENKLSIEEKVEKLEKFRDKILNISKDIVNARIILIEENEETLFINKYKNLYQKIPQKIFVMVAFVKAKDGTIKTAYKSFVSNDLEILTKAQNEFSTFETDIENLKTAKKLKGGKYEVVLAPQLTGLLAHESFGHGMEADTMMKQRALASSWIGKKIGETDVNIVDYPAIKNKHGEYYFDHEGNLAQKIYLVKNGIVNKPIADLYSKSKLNLEESSNGRFESFDHKAYARMSNTYFEAGNKEFNELISKVKDGIYVFSAGGGMEDPKNWSVQIQGCTGQRIKDGKLINEFYDGFTFTGFLPDIIGNIKGISKEIEIDGGGSCGKGHKEWVRVSEGGPFMLISEVILG